MPAGYGDGFEVDPDQVRDYGEGTRLEARELERSRNTSLEAMTAGEPGIASGIAELADLAQQHQLIRDRTRLIGDEAIYGVDLLGAGATFAANNYDAADTAAAQRVVEGVGDRLAHGPITPDTSAQLADQ